MITKTSCFYLGVAMMGLALWTNTAASQTLVWSESVKYDKGDSTTLALHPLGLVLEAHQSESIGSTDLWYRVGKSNGYGVDWGRSQNIPWRGEWPNVVISNQGYVILVFSTGAYKSNSSLLYAVGKIDINGGKDQSITWLTRELFWVNGFHSSTAINDAGVIVSVHEGSSKGMYYRVGHLTNPSRGDYTMTWDSGKYGIKFDDGINPHIAINNSNQVVEVHQVSAGEKLLHYHRGSVNSGTITFRASQRYDDNSAEPAVALLDNGLVVETDRSEGNAFARTGTPNSSNLALINWSDPVQISDDESDHSRYPAVAANRNSAVATWTSYHGYTFTGTIYFAVTSIP
jgi:hypothetical protein